MREDVLGCQSSLSRLNKSCHLTPFTTEGKTVCFKVQVQGVWAAAAVRSDSWPRCWGGGGLAFRQCPWAS